MTDRDLKHTIKIRCPSCGRKRLTVRADELPVAEDRICAECQREEDDQRYFSRYSWGYGTPQRSYLQPYKTLPF